MNINRILISNDLVTMRAINNSSESACEFACVTLDDKSYTVCERTANAVYKHAVDYTSIKVLALRAYNAKRIASAEQCIQITDAYKHMMRTAKVLFKLAIVIECENNNK